MNITQRVDVFVSSLRLDRAALDQEFPRTKVEGLVEFEMREILIKEGLVHGEITLEVPDDVLQRLSSGGMEVAGILNLAAAFSLCSNGKLSTSQAARLAGLTYADFLEAAVQEKIELFPVSIEELKEEISRGFTLGRQHLADHIASQNRTD